MAATIKLALIMVQAVVEVLAQQEQVEQQLLVVMVEMERRLLFLVRQ
jgi:hypothetical protein